MIFAASIRRVTRNFPQKNYSTAYLIVDLCQRVSAGTTWLRTSREGATPSLADRCFDSALILAEYPILV